MADPLASGPQDQVDAAVLLALALDLADLDQADLAGPRDMRAAAGLQVDAFDLEQPDPSLAGRRLHRHGADQLGPRRQLLVGDPARPHRMILGDEAIDAGGDLLAVELAVGQVEIQPTLAVADLAAGDVAGHHGGQEVQAGVHAHQPVAAVPVDPRDDLGADRRQYGIGDRDVPDAVGGIALDRVDDGDRPAVGQPQRPGVARLAAAGGIEHGAVEHDAAGIGGGNHRPAF